MSTVYNIYCDESCHLENDHSPIMVVGGVWCKKSAVGEISTRMREIKKRHGLAGYREVKWMKLSPAKLQLYVDLVDYFFDDDDLHFRGYIIEKDGLNHGVWHQSHDEWYYKMCFRMLEPIISPSDCYNIYLDIKDTKSELKRRKLEEVLRNSQRDWDSRIIKKVQQVRSNESELLQMADLLIGAISHLNRGLQGNAKSTLIRRIQERSGKDLTRSTLIREPKLNLFRWNLKAGAND